MSLASMPTLGGYLTSWCPSGAGLHVHPWTYSIGGATVTKATGGLPPDTRIQPCPSCNPVAPTEETP